MLECTTTRHHRPPYFSLMHLSFQHDCVLIGVFMISTIRMFINFSFSHSFLISKLMPTGTGHSKKDRINIKRCIYNESNKKSKT